MSKITVLVLLFSLELLMIFLIILDSKTKRKEEFKDDYERKISEGLDLKISSGYWLTMIAIAIVIVMIVADLLGT